ncbi:conjugal transfer protein TraF [Vibrio lentus]|uniref:conjugal transfer protein TraF n=1 Tax=Vibrio lentus TaxID=136468 RepID=UPI0039A4DA4E
MTFKKVLLQHPELSYLKDRLAEFAARGTYHKLEREKKIDAVAHMRDEGWGFFFVYDGQRHSQSAIGPVAASLFRYAWD